MESTKKSDVIVVITKNGEIINASGGIMSGLEPVLGSCLLGYMKLGDKK